MLDLAAGEAVALAEVARAVRSGGRPASSDVTADVEVRPTHRVHEHAAAAVVRATR